MIVRHTVPHSRRGFTLMEVMIVVSIMAVVMAVAMPAIFRSARKQPLQLAVDAVSGICTKARTEAILKRQRRQVYFALSGKPRSVVLLGPGAVRTEFGGNGEAVSTQTAATEIARIILPDIVEITPADSQLITFRPDGTCDGITLELRAEGHSYKIELEPATSLTLIKENY
ncbi:MAG: prepilin-type N-terminal cleavage/methylation domain-containing protein [Pedosphaera sp.]|nr:prepilin-type N-terminal cleavage/methylation domain-containing protein [Pedosphaera sp.]MSU43450.1 prepilin-type N-terminal cleavage/methylation domain-containing protein [Pedosphaera sp.]